MKKTQLIIIIGVVSAFVLTGIVALSLALYYFGFQTNTSNVANSNTASVANTKTTATPATDDIPFIPKTSSTGTSTIKEEIVTAWEILLRLFLAVVLSTILAFRPRKNVPLFQRNLNVAQTQILLAVVAAALMMIVGDNAARAFAIFAAVSLVRFRTNIRDPKEVTVLLISLALGLATGVGRWELGAVLCVFSLVLLWFLEFKEPEQVFRSMELTVKTRNTDATQAFLKRLFDRYRLEAEVRQLDPADEENPVGSIMYYLNLRVNISTDFLSDRILASDPTNIEGIQWAQKKSAANIFG